MSSQGGKKEVAAKPVGNTTTAPAEGTNVMDDLSKKQAFKKFSYRGEDINKLLTLNVDEIA
jgi:hypothetical protein